MKKRLFVSVILGWFGLFLIATGIVVPLVLGVIVGGVVPYENLIPFFTSIVIIGTTLGFAFFIPCSTLIVLTLKVFDHDDDS